MLLNEGVRTILVLDAAGPGGRYEVMRDIANVINEVGKGGAAAPGEALTLEEALRMWTLTPAEANGEGHDKGSISVGKFGDFAVLSADPRGRSSAEVYEIKAEATILGGTVVYGSQTLLRNASAASFLERPVFCRIIEYVIVWIRADDLELGDHYTSRRMDRLEGDSTPTSRREGRRCRVQSVKHPRKRLL